MQHTSESILNEKISTVKLSIREGGYYYHYKDPSKLYKLLNVVLNEATEEPMIIYKAEYGKN